MKLKYLISALLIVAACDDFKQENLLPQEPSVPTEVVAVPSEDEFTLNFQWPAAEGAVEYAYVLKDRYGDIVDYGKTSETSVSMTDLSKGYKYTFEVKAVNGAAESAFSQPTVAVPGGVELQPYGTFALELYSMDGDVQVDTLTVFAQDAQSNVFKAGFKDVALTDQTRKFRLLYLTEGEYSNISFEIKYTKDGQICEYTMPVDGTVNVVCDQTASLSAPVLAYDEDDFYSVWYHGRDITIAGQTVNRATCPKAQLKTMSALTWDELAKPYDAAKDGGILFLDNDPAVQTYKATTSNRTIGENKIIIGRYRNAAQPLFRYTVDGNYAWAMSGTVMIKNVNFSLFQSKPGRPLIIGTTNYGDGKSEFYFDDCTLISVGGKGIFACNASTWSVPKTMRFDNCILRADASFFNTSESNPTATSTSAVFNKMAALENLTFNGCVFAPVSSSNTANAKLDEQVSTLNSDGVLVNLCRPNHKLDNLNVSFRYCSFYELGPATPQYAMVYLTTMKSLNVEQSVFYSSAWAKNAYLLKILENCPEGATYSGSAVYTNSISNNNKQYLAVGSASAFTGFGITRTLTITNKGAVALFGDAEPLKHYFPKAIDFTDDAGASYDTKYWIVPTSQPSEESTQSPE